MQGNRGHIDNEQWYNHVPILVKTSCKGELIAFPTVNQTS